MRRALDEFDVSGGGVKTTIEFHKRVMDHPVFQSGEFSTDFVDRYMST
jgi:acetyl-CoA carboxylase biotin carboxylase subunit